MHCEGGVSMNDKALLITAVGAVRDAVVSLMEARDKVEIVGQSLYDNTLIGGFGSEYIFWLADVEQRLYREETQLSALIARIDGLLEEEDLLR